MRRLRTRPEDAGTISVIAVGALVAVVAAATLAVDLGRVAWSGRDQQGATDRAALDALRAITDLWNVETAGWNGFGTYDAQNRAENLAAGSLGENAGVEARPNDTRVTEVHLGTWDRAGNEFWVWNGTFGGDCSFDRRNCFPTAVFVQTTSNVSTLFTPSSSVRDGDQVVKEAIAEIHNNAAVRVGSSAATMDSNDASLLNEIWGDLVDVSLGVVEYNGLLDAQIEIDGLLAALGITVGSPDAVVDDATVSLAQLFTASATALTNQGDAASLAAATVFAQLATDVDATVNVTLGEMLSLTVGDVGTIGDVAFNAFNLVQAAIVAGDGTNFANVSGFESLVPGVVSATFDLTVVEPEQLAAGPGRWNPVAADWFTIASSSQVDLDFDLDLAPAVFGAYQPLEINLPLHLRGGQAEAAVTASWCLNDREKTGGRTLTNTAAATAWLGGVNPGDWQTVTTLRVGVPLLGIIDVARVRIRATETASAAWFEGDHDPLPETVSGGGNAIDVSGLIDPGSLQTQVVLLPGAQLNPLPLNQNNLVNRVVQQLTPVLDSVDANVIARLTSMMGLSMGAADTTLDDVHCSGGRILVK